VGKVTPDNPKDQFVSDMVSIVAKACEAEIKEADVIVQVLSLRPLLVA